MAPSPDKTIVPKAPDKRNGVSNSDNFTASIGKNTSVNDTAIVNQQEPQDNPPALSKLDEGQLKALLEEAITYKRPKDRECKSSLFKELLHEAESSEAAPPLCRTRFQSERNETRNYNNSSHQLNKHSQRQLSHGGSLQDLADSCKFFDNNSTKIDSYSSRKNTGAKRKTVSVSARQSEGGSLPSNVNNSSTFAYDRLFLYDDKFRKCGLTNTDDYKELCKIDLAKRDFNDIYTTSCEINLNKTASSSNSSLLRFSPVPNNLIDPDVIEECQAALLDSALSDDEQKQFVICSTQEKNSNDERSDKTGKSSKLNYTSHAEFQISMENNNQNGMDSNRSSRSKNTSNDFGSTIQFSQFEKPLLLTSTYAPVQCLIGTGKSATSLTRPISWLTPAAIPALLQDDSKKSLDENGNSLQAFNSTMASSQQQNALKIKREKPKQKKSDRNVKVIRSEEVVGHRNETNIDLLVKFIENDVNPKKLNGFSKVNKSNCKSDNISNKQRYLEDKNKKKDNRKNKDIQRNLFKSNSLEEVSCSMLEDLTNDSSGITMRNKSKKESSSSNDRRSWGEVSYMGENNFNDSNSKTDEKIFEQMFDPNVSLTNELSNNYAELAEFHVVTKKKKPKKYHNHNIFNDEKTNLQRNGYYHNHKYQENNFANNDLYLNHGAMAEQRRKSTSSMPPSDKSDSSDLDSVHSLPVESTSKKLAVRQISTSSGGTPLASYADITKMPNVSNDTCNDICFNSDQDKWSSESKNMFPSLIETTTNDKSNHPKTMSLNNYNFPDLIESCHYYSEVQKKKENEENNKQEASKNRSKLKLSQSKSVDMEDVYIQNKNTRNNDEHITKSINKSNKDNPKIIKNKSNIEEQLKEPKSINNKNGFKEKQNNASSEYSLIESNNKKKNMNMISMTSDLVSDCIHHDILNEKNKEMDIESADPKQSLPPVIILNEEFNLDEPAENDITFGFELNEKLLSGELSDTDSNNTVVYQDLEITDGSVVKGNYKVDICENSKNSSACSAENVQEDVISTPIPKLSSKSNDKNYSCEYAGHNNKSICDNFKTKVQINNSKCLNSIKFIPPSNSGSFENHDKIVSFIGIAWDEILKGGTAQYYTG